MRDTHRTPDMPIRGMRIALGILKRIPVPLHVGTTDCYEDQSSREPSAFNGLSDWSGFM